MPLVLADRVRETTTTTGTGTISLAGPVSGFQGFSTAIGNANTTYYTIVDAATGAWEVGLGTYTSSGSTLARTTVLSSSNSDALVPFGAGTKDVFVTQPAERAVYVLGAGTGLAAGAAAFTANGVPYASATNTLTTGSALTFDGSVFGVAPATGVVAKTKQLVLNNFTGEGVGITFSRTNDDIEVNAIGTANSNWDMGIFARENIIFATGGGSTYSATTEQMRITAAGDVGIGTSLPAGKLAVSGSLGTVYVDTSGIQLAFTRPSTNYISAPNGGFQFNASAYEWTNSSQTQTYATLNSSGNLGIGTASPATKLHVNTGAAGYGITVAANAQTSITYQLGIDSNSNLAVYDTNAAAQRLVLSTSGNLGLGVTPSAFGGAYRGFQIGGNPVITGANAPDICGNAYHDGTNWRYIGTTFAARYSVNQNNGGIHAWFTAPSGTAGDAITFTQAMTLDASGNLGLGETSPSQRLHIKTSAAAVALFDSTEANGGYLTFSRSGTAKGYIGSAYHLVIPTGSNDDFTVRAVNNLIFATGTTERARITSGGNLLVGTTDDSTANKFVINGAMSFVNGATTPQVNYYSSASTIEFVNRDSGGAKTFSWYYGASGGGSPATLSTSGVWTNASDARGKENIASIHYGLDAVMALTPRQYDVKSDGSHAIGFVAQEVLPIIPELVHVTKRDNDNEFYGLDYGSMTAVLVKAIQELKAEFDAYKATHP